MTFQRGRLSLLQNIQEAHKEDIRSYVSGHLNHSKLPRFDKPKNQRERWSSSMEAPVRLKPASYPVQLPVRKGQISKKCQRQKDMQDTMKEFSFGALGRFEGCTDSCSPCDSTMRDSTRLSMRSLPYDSSQVIDKTEKDNSRTIFAEDLKLPEITTHDKDSLGGNSPRKNRTAQNRIPLSRQFIQSHLGHVTKEDQYGAMKNFEQTVMNLADASDKGLLTGDRIVRKLRESLRKKLQPLSESSKRGPNFHRLQAYSDCFDNIIEKSTTFSRLLRMIKDEYDSYLAYILDQSRISQHRALYSHMPSLTKAKSVAEAVRRKQLELEKLEDEVRDLLTENDRLRKAVSPGEKQKPVSAASEDVSESAFNTRIHVEEVPKDFQEQVEDYHSQIAEQLETLENMRKYQRENCVPSSVCQHFEHCIKETEVDIQKLLKQNEFLEQSIEELEQELEMILAQSKVSEKNARSLWKRINISKVLEYGRNNEDQ